MNKNGYFNHTFTLSETQFLSSKTKQSFCHVKDNRRCKKKTKTLPGISSSDTLVANQFFVTSCLMCPQDQTAAIKYYWGQNISTNSYFLQATEERKQHWQQYSLVLQCSTFKVQLPLILNEECNKAIPHVWTLSCCWDTQPPVSHVKNKDWLFFLRLII